MKKILTILLCALLCFSVNSCNKVEETEETEKEIIVPLSDVEAYELSNQTLEESLEYATDIVKAECVSIGPMIRNREYEFKVISRYYGENVDENISVVVMQKYKPHVYGFNSKTGKDENFSYREDLIEYEVGKQYYLMLTRNSRPFYSHDVYFQIQGIPFFPLDDLSQSSMYNNAISNHSKIEELNSEQDLLDYINSMSDKIGAAIENKKFLGNPRVVYQTIDEIRENSDIIAVLEAVEPLSFIFYSYTWNFKLLSVIQGEIEESKVDVNIGDTLVECEVENCTINVSVGPTELKPGDKIILAFNKDASGNDYAASCSNALIAYLP